MWTGLDINLEISAFEYGILYNEQEGIVLMGYPTTYCSDIEFKMYQYPFKPSDINEIMNESWFQRDQGWFLSFIGADTINQFLELDTVQQLDSLTAYFGQENILGGIYGRKCYNKEEIENLIENEYNRTGD